MHDGHGKGEAALTELRAKLTDGLARARPRLTKTQLAGKAELGRTTVQEAFRADAPAPSAETVAALARALRLPVAELLDLRRAAVAATVPPRGDEAAGPGRPIGQWDPHDLEVHPATTVSGGYRSGAVARTLPGYVRRDHDRVLAGAVDRAAQGRSGMLVLVGSSSTGKTRACWEAVQPLAAHQWRLWHPYDPTRAEAALDELEQVAARTVVWLNEGQHYLGDPQYGERIAAAVHALLTRPDRRPVLVLGTLWPEYADRYTALPSPGGRDPHSRVRELLAGRILPVPDAFDQAALRTAASLARNGDRLLADALTRAGTHGRITQDLAGAPELVRRYEHSTPAARALLEAAMDARRLGVGPHLSHSFLADAAVDYLSDHDYDELTEDWAEAAFADLARPVHGRQAPLRPTRARPRQPPPGGPERETAPAPQSGPVFRLADYLEQHGRATRRALCPPDSFWAAAHAHLSRAGDLNNLARAATDRSRLRWASHLRLRAADAGDPDALIALAVVRREAGDPEGAEALYGRAADAGNPDAQTHLARARETAGDPAAAEALYRQAADAGNTLAQAHLAMMREEAGDLEGAEAFARQAADAGNPVTLAVLAEMRKENGDHEGAEALHRRATEASTPVALVLLAQMRREAGDPEGAEALYRRAADAGNSDALGRLARMRFEAGDREGAEALYREAAAAGNPVAVSDLAWMRVEAGDHEGAESLYRRAADTGNTLPLVHLADMLLNAGERASAEPLYRRAARAGDVRALIRLARVREEAGDPEGAETLYRKAADTGDRDPSFQPESRWPYGLDPDGTPTPLWT